MGLRNNISEHFRGRRDELLRSMIVKLPRKKDTLTILDLGGRQDYWKRVGYPFLQDANVHIVIQNLYALEFRDDEQAPEGMFSHSVGNACNQNYADNHFDFCHSNSVIEHVGLWSEMEKFANETRRVAVSYYVQTPNYWFPIEPHFPKFPFNHWFPRPVRAGLMRALPLSSTGRAKNTGIAYRKIDSARLLTKGQIKYLFPDAVVNAERLAGLPKSYIATRIGSTSAY